MRKFELYRRVFRTIADAMTHGVVLYGYGKNGRKAETFCKDVGISVRTIYDRKVSEKLENEGG